MICTQYLFIGNFVWRSRVKVTKNSVNKISRQSIDTIYRYKLPLKHPKTLQNSIKIHLLNSKATNFWREKKKTVMFIREFFASIKHDFKRNPSADYYPIRHINFFFCFCFFIVTAFYFKADRCCDYFAKERLGDQCKIIKM